MFAVILLAAFLQVDNGSSTLEVGKVVTVNHDPAFGFPTVQNGYDFIAILKAKDEYGAREMTRDKKVFRLPKGTKVLVLRYVDPWNEWPLVEVRVKSTGPLQDRKLYVHEPVLKK